MKTQNTISYSLVKAGKSTSCTAQPSGLPNFKFTANVTSEISTCDPLGLTISGGTSPYIVSLVPSNAPAVTNVTLPLADDSYTYINRASPGGELVGKHRFAVRVLAIIYSCFVSSSCGQRLVSPLHSLIDMIQIVNAGVGKGIGPLELLYSKPKVRDLHLHSHISIIRV